MYFTLILENESGEQVNLSTTANQYMTSKIEGLNPPAGTISTSSYAGMNGSYLNNAFIEKRNVVISFAMRGIGIEKRRHQLYRVVKPSRYIKIWYRTANIDVYAEGYVETCEVSNFEQQISGQISILCPDIYWYSRDIFYAYYSGITGAFHFPFPESDDPFPLGVYSNSNLFSITNDGDEIGFTLRIEALPSDIPQEVVAVTPTIYNENGEYLQIKGDILTGDVITVTTKTGNKTVTLTRNGVDSNILNRLVSGSTWLTLKEGTNTFRVEAVRGVKKLRVTLMHPQFLSGGVKIAVGNLQLDSFERSDFLCHWKQSVTAILLSCGILNFTSVAVLRCISLPVRRMYPSFSVAELWRGAMMHSTSASLNLCNWKPMLKRAII